VPLSFAIAALLAQTAPASPPAGPPTSGPVGPIFADPARIGQPPLPTPSPSPAPAPLPQARSPTPAPTPSIVAGSPPRGPVEQLPEPTGDPLRIERSADPILGLARGSTSPSEFRTLVQQAVDRSPRVDEAEAGITEAEAARREARAGLFPSGDVGLNTTQSIDRRFGDNDVDNIVERSRGRSRTDLTLSLNQMVFDWGATASRIDAAGARLRAAASQAEVSADDVALRAIAAWYDVFAYRALVALGSSFTSGQQDLRSAIQTRISQGVSAPGDLPRVESYIATADADLARYRRQLANAEARFQEIYGVAPAPDLGRAPVIPGPTLSSRDAAQALARNAPQVQAAEAVARAARQDARAEYRSSLPAVSAGIDAGRYDLIDSSDYDIRARATVRYRFLGGVEARVEQSEARAAQAEARAVTVRNEAEREAAIAWSDVQALEQQLVALENSYVASRQSRDVLAERFRVARGTLFDLLESESGYFNVAALYVRAITELDAARYVLLSRTGQLLPTLSIEPPAGGAS
jgi:adhesin transport system outer membrane protein